MRRLALAHAIALVVSCSDSAPEPSPREDAGLAAASDSERSGITLTGAVADFPDAIALVGAALEGVEVCEDESRTCTLTDRDGWFALDGLPPETEILLVFRQAGYVPAVQAMESPRWSTMLGTRAMTDPNYNRDAFNAQLRAAGLPEVVPFDERFAAISFQAIVGLSGGVEPGVHVTLDPPSGTGPFYIYSDNGPSLEPPSDTAAVFGAFLNVEPREEGYELVYSYASGECVRYANMLGGWQPSSGRVNAIRVPARRGYTTYPSAAYCWDDRDGPSAARE